MRVSYLILLGLLAAASILPPHVAARCFGVPEDFLDTTDAAWTLNVEVLTDNGFRRAATLGFHPNATDGYDEAFDIWEPLFNFEIGPENPLDLFAYFYYPENAEPGIDTFPVTVGLRTSIIEPKGLMSWPLRIGYFLDEATNITLRWDSAAAEELDGYEVEMHTPFNEIFSMANVSSYTYLASRGLHDFTIDAHGESEEEGPGVSQDLVLLVGAISAYAIVVVVILGLRWARTRRARTEEEEEKVPTRDPSGRKGDQDS